MSASTGLMRAGAATLLLLSAACSASPQAGSASSARPPAAVPRDALTLAGLGLRHGPADLLLPRTTVMSGTIDQPNVVTLFLPPEQGPGQAQWLTTRLGDGWVVEAHRGTSVVFRTRDGVRPPWQGGFTCAPTSCALTLRQQ